MLNLDQCVDKFKDYWSKSSMGKSGDYKLSKVCNELSDKFLFWVERWTGADNHPEWNELEKLLNEPLEGVDGFAVDKNTGEVTSIMLIYDDYSKDQGKKIDISKVI